MTTLIAIPQTALQIGPIGPFVSPRLPVDIPLYTVSLTGVVWPASGDVLKVTLERSDDDGVTWKFDASAQGSFRDKAGNPPNNALWRIGMPVDGVTTRRLRATIEVLQPCTLIASVSG